MRIEVCEICGNGINIKRGYFVRVYEESPEKHIYHLFCFKDKIINDQRRRIENKEKERGVFLQYSTYTKHMMICQYCGHYMIEVDIEMYECHNPRCPNYMGYGEKGF